MGTRRQAASLPTYARDLLGIALYVGALAAIALAAYAGIRAAAPTVMAGVAELSHDMDRWTDPDTNDTRQLSNFQRWIAAREVAKQPRPLVVAQPVPEPAEPVTIGPVGVAAAAKAKALAELRSRRGARATRARAVRSEDGAALPPTARPAEQTGYIPPPQVDKHRVY